MPNLLKKKYRKFIAWMDYNPPSALSSKGWRLFKKEFKDRAPIRYYLRNGFTKTFIWPIKWKYTDIRNWVYYRTTHRYHVLDTGLDPGYYGFDTKMLHVNFNMLKDFVEVEQAWSSYMWSAEYQNASWFEKHMPFYYRIYPFRDPKIGIKHLEWASTLDDPSLPPHERSDHQAHQARETLALYKWWVDARPAREPIPHIPYSDQGLGSLGCFDDDFDGDAADYKAHVASMAAAQTQEDDWETEDQDMLIRLIKIRKGLWT